MATGDTQPEPADAPPAYETLVAETKLHECMICAEEFPLTELVRLACNDTYCKPCLQKTFEMAMKEETAFPPSCCDIRIRANFVRKHLPKSLLRKYIDLQSELSTIDRTYCHRPTCSAFIPSHSIHTGNGLAICQKCFSVTCSKCRQQWHWGPCGEDEDEEFFEFVFSKNWKRCPGCRRVISKNHGCNHMTCRCGTEFCYTCGETMIRCRRVHHQPEYDPDHDEDEDEDEEEEDEQAENEPEETRESEQTEQIEQTEETEQTEATEGTAETREEAKEAE